jgi:UDPglucose 6-dehydrogenase
MKVGIVGLGFVGGAIKHAYDLAGIEVVVIDPFKGYMNSYRDIMDCDAVFVSVFSPQSEDGTCDTSALENVLGHLSENHYNGVIISKVTAPPSTYQRLQEKHENLVHAPEFLTAANANNDYLNGEFIVVGGKGDWVKKAHEVIIAGQKNVIDVSYTEIGEASLTKYAINCFLATKVSFMNELYNLCKTANLNFEAVKVSMSLDRRQGGSHFDVPGPDGKFGFGGACFPKDTSALLKYAESINANLGVLNTAVLVNKVIRND